MSDEKTEQPTQHKLKESAEKGESYKSKDAVAATIIVAGMVMISVMSFAEVGEVFKDFISRGNNISIAYATDRAFGLFLSLTLPFVGVCILATVIPSLLQSKFVLAFKAFKFNLDSLNPVNGFKNMFSMKTVKELVKALVYLAIFFVVTLSFFKLYQRMLLDLIYVQAGAIARIWVKAGTSIVLLCLIAFLVVIVLDGIADYLIYIKKQKMDKHEVKQEYKEMEGNPEVKSRRKEVHQELLSASEKTDIEQSNFVLANPTHIAIGIFANPEISPMPLISLVAKGEKALAIIRYAEKHGVPVVRDILVARRLFKEARRYEFIPMEMVEPIFRILVWLKEVELAHLKEMHPELAEQIDAAVAAMQAQTAAVAAELKN